MVDSDSTGLGDYEGLDYLIQKENKDNAAIAKGDVVDLDSSGKWRKCPTTGFSAPYGVAPIARLTTDTDLPVFTKGIICVTADGDIVKGKFVQPSGTTAGQVIEYAAATIGTTPGKTDVEAARDDWKRVVGRYIGKPGQNNVGSLPTDAVDGDLILIHVGNR